ncbi:DNA photolyase family protein [Rhodoblastus acidophilus]|uniref:DNA photolyase family protein n=1 Tax=Candidatus Rhodoblastus alkanivorans TaxID=2954117 RepID=A0ABS9Z6Z9_9HYPH|nr:deoxyribodipyrimidine photo-lyase [Candidatus Rhodoblastus alkanivorans]MCI4679579.1 DNA photolyase family protein [Candidatus Rhodoblastus alkanivorans]MCI4683404.1 DNA photolyase family protein [Candidatus Rhodoblastus alkanivorans]MDI4640714.1 DNA photolyase family protein [Rhodoblastus acidophilus]
MPQPCALVWFRNDLRVSDHPTLAMAAASGLPLLCLYILDAESPGLRPPGGASLWRLDRALAALERELASRGGELHFLRGPAETLLPEVARAANAQRIFWSRRYSGAEIALDIRLKQALREQGREAYSCNASLLAEPWQVISKSGGAFKVFTPFWRALREKIAPPPPLPAPERLSAAPWPAGAPQSLAREALRLAPSRPNWAAGFPDPDAGEAGARKRLGEFLDHTVEHYATNRDRLDRDATSRLSAHLHFGEISPRQIISAAPPHPGADKFLAELGWREFSCHLLYANPDLAWRNFNPRFDGFPYRADDSAQKDLPAWRRGETGYPVVDAAMRELWTTGFMHNRARMVVASFLTKHLLIDWREGESWFWDTLIDADEANNAASWQWVAGCGADAAPYFRIFNPVLQGEKFDPDGAYVRAHCPELAGLPMSCLHKPWAAPASVLAEAGLRLGETYPRPIVDHDFARRRALDAFTMMTA